MQTVRDEPTPRDWYVRHLPGTNDLTYEVRVYIDSWEVRIQITDSTAGGGGELLDVSADGARELAAHLIEAAELVGHITSRDRVDDAC